jgi:hypothetical protein
MACTYIHVASSIRFDPFTLGSSEILTTSDERHTYIHKEHSERKDTERRHCTCRGAMSTYYATDRNKQRGSTPYNFSNTVMVQLAHLACHAQARALPRFQSLGPPLLVVDRLAMSVKAQDLHQLRDLGVVPRRPHPMTPRDPLLLPRVPVIPESDARRSADIHADHPLDLADRRRHRRDDRQGLEEELAADLPLVSGLEHQSRLDLL